MSGIGQGSKALLMGLGIFTTFIERILTSFSIFLLITMWVLLLYNTVHEWLDTSWITTWTLEIVGWMVAWSIFVLMGPVAKWDTHIKVTYFPTRLLGERVGAAFVQMVENMAGLAVGIFMSIHSMRFIYWTTELPGNMANPESVAGWTYPLWAVHSGLFVGFVTLSVFYFNRIILWIVNIVSQRGQVNVNESGMAEEAN
ncbi:TRAP transporter small permease [Chloroflexota bacterium]